MNPDAPAEFPQEPPSVAEWEDLLVRFEIMPRALSQALEQLAGEAGASDELSALVHREEWAAAWLEAIRTRSAHPTSTAAPVSGPVSLDRFRALRARNFAMLQRRGVEIWSWRAHDGKGDAPTVHQVISWLVARDRESLRSIREAHARASLPC